MGAQLRQSTGCRNQARRILEAVQGQVGKVQDLDEVGGASIRGQGQAIGQQGEADRPRGLRQALDIPTLQALSQAAAQLSEKSGTPG